jgi:hypothetical protein
LRGIKYNKILITLIIVGLFSAFVVSWQRHMVEQSNTSVELVMDYEDIMELAQTEGISAPELLHEFRDSGITSLAVYETTLEKLNKSGKVTVFSGAQLINQYHLGTLTDKYWRNLIESNIIYPEDTYILGHYSDIFKEVRNDIIRRTSPQRVVMISDDNHQVLAVKGIYEKIIKLNLGLSTDEMRVVADAGFYVVVRPTNYTKVQTNDITAMFERLDEIKNVSAVMFTGEEVLGYPNLLPLTSEQFKQRQLTLAMIEHPLQLQFLNQEGLMPLVAAIGYQAARVYVIPKAEQPKMKIKDAVQRWIQTDQDRNIRINLLRKYDNPELGKTLMETNLEYIRDLKQALLDNSFTIGRAGIYQPYFPNSLLLIFIVIGVTAAGILLISLLYPFSTHYQYLLLIIISAFLAILLLKDGSILIRQVVATASATIFPVLAMTWQLDYWRNTIVPGRIGFWRIMLLSLCGLGVTVGLSMIGGFYVGSILADVRFLLEIEIFRGVKLIFIAPLILITMIYLTRYNLFEDDVKPNFGQQIVKLLNYPVCIKILFGVGIAAVVAWVYIGRSGHTAGVPVPTIEIKMRQIFDSIMYARPRTKEFMIGHPAFMLIVMAMYKKWPRILQYVLILFATIGQMSLVETFAHIRTPIFISFIRGLDGLFMGAICGGLLLIGVQVLYYFLFLKSRGMSNAQ